MNPTQGIVLATDDPDGRGRVRIAVPALGEDWTAWAFLLQSFGIPADTDRPLPGERVAVFFLDGDEEQPLVAGRLGEGALS